MKTVTLEIDGMHCDSCAVTIKTLIEKQPGVQAVTVSYGEGRTRILYDPRATGEGHLVAVVQQSGFRVVGRDESNGG